MTLDEALARFPEAETFKFGDGPDLSAELIGLVRAGVKTASCGALRDFGADGQAMPVVGRQDICLNWDGTPALVIETVEVTKRRFCDVDADFALAEGEDDTLEGWQEGHRGFFERNGGWEPEMMLLCERFKLVEDFG